MLGGHVNQNRKSFQREGLKRGKGEYIHGIVKENLKDKTVTEERKCRSYIKRRREKNIRSTRAGGRRL